VQTSTNSMILVVNTSDLAAPGEPVPGFYGGELVGAGVTGVSLTVTANNGSSSPTILNTGTMTGAAAQAYFTDTPSTTSWP